MRDSSTVRSSAGSCSRFAAGDGKRGRKSFPDQPMSGMMPVEVPPPRTRAARSPRFLPMGSYRHLVV